MRTLPPITDKASLEAAWPVLALARTAADASRLAISNALDLALDLALDRDLDRDLDRALALALDLDRDLALDRDLDRALRGKLNESVFGVLTRMTAWGTYKELTAEVGQ